MNAPADSRVAVIGMAFRFPGADTPEEFWRVVRDGRDCVRRFTDAELAAAGVPAEKYRADGFVGASGLLHDIAGFDAPFFGMSVREARLTDPQHRMFLECAYHALEDSGHPRERDGLRTGVFATTGYHLYMMENYLQNNVLKSSVGDDWLSRMQVMVGNHTDFTATRVSFRLDLTGPAVSVQTGCSSSLVALQMAAQSVVTGDSDIALAGATAVHVPQVLGYQHVKGSILSKSGRLRAFDAGADGTVGGTGVAAVVLKRLDRAVADGDTIHGVIRGWGVTNDGASKQAYTAPSAAGQRAAIRRALEHAGIGADTVGYLETHGTGTFKGDPIEFDGAVSAYRADTDRTGYCALGSTKANIGHLDVASGLASFIKALLVLKHGVIPPMANFSEPNPALDLDNSPFYIPRTARPWPQGGTPRRAGVTSLGVGGTNVHVIVEQAPEPAPRSATVAPPDIVLLSGQSEAARTANAEALRDHLTRHPDTDLADLVTTTAGRVHHRHRLAVRGTDPATLAAALDRWLAGTGAQAGPAPVTTGEAPREARAGIAFQFTGQGSPYPGMAQPLYERFTVVRDLLDTCERHHQRLYGSSLLGVLLDPIADRAATENTHVAQPALFALQYALTGLWRQAGIVPDTVAGHSVGEYAALCAAGALSAEDGLRLTAERGRLMQEHCAPGTMAAVSADPRTAEDLAAEVPGLELAVVNGEQRYVLAGPVTAVDRLLALLEERGIPGQRLPVTRAFHTALMDPVLDKFRELLDGVAFRPVTTGFVSGLDGRLREPGWVPDADYLVRQTREPVRFDAVLRTLRGTGPAALVEIGPHTTLSGLARTALPTVRAVPTLRRGAGTGPFWDAVVQLHCAGADLDWPVLLAGTGGRRTALPGYRFQHTDHWTGPELTVVPAAQPQREPSREEEDVAQDEAVFERVLAHVIELVAKHLGHDAAAITGDTSFFDLGADSLQMISVLRELEQEHRVKVAMRELFEEASTPGQLAELIVGRMVGGADTTSAGGAVRYEPPVAAVEPVRYEPPVVEEPVRYEPPAAAVEAVRDEPPVAEEPVWYEPAAAATPAEPVRAPEPTPAQPSGPEHPVTRAELADLARQVRQLSQIQLQMMSQIHQLSQLLTAQATSAPTGGTAANGKAGGR
ncbi:acyltransferase domain-containing protein [Streptomyces albofaciens JCM 4342]|uniref:type I polyketide synthase n=1 Tax=Streptomyces albofaciens TaxID=66866 RepID=UPI00123B5622|nr:type I polyketide synthase [Streptomyces albofaciens]KAA6212180.1 acyltransferase domain-containing protein [Streptomyces albofaciens JCM 4342]